MEDHNPNSFWTPGTENVLAGMPSSSNTYIQIKWCVKTTTSGDTGIKWPPGSYCIGRKEGSCPKGFNNADIFQTGYLKWDDEDGANNNLYEGTLPDGQYDYDTIMYFCCCKDLHPTNPIHLPTDQSFFLLRSHVDGCQAVNGMKVTPYRVRWDDEDSHNADQSVGGYPYDEAQITTSRSASMYLFELYLQAVPLCRV